MAPATPRLIDRDDLLAALDGAAAKKVTIISAPAGSGKTSLLRAWADRPDQPRRLAVVQVRRDQLDAQDFWLALLDAVRRVRGAASGAEPPAATPEFNAATMVGRVLSELADAGGGGIMLVIDDLHELNSPETLGQLTQFTNLPDGVHAMLTMRHDLPLRLHQLRLADELAEIRAADLQFTERETRELLAASGIKLSEGGTALLHERTEGWAAGLRLAALSLAGHSDPERFVADFSGTNRAVAEYLLAEMLERQPGDVQDLLLRTCLLDQVNGELADLLTDPHYPVPSRTAGAGTVFTTGHPRRLTIWVMVGQRPNRVRYARVTPHHLAGTVEVRALSRTRAGTTVRVTYDLTALTDTATGELAAFAAGYQAEIDTWASDITDSLARRGTTPPRGRHSRRRRSHHRCAVIPANPNTARHWHAIPNPRRHKFAGTQS